MSTTADTATVSQTLTGAQRALVSREVVARANGRTDRASRIAWTATLRAPVDPVRLRAAIQSVILNHPIMSVRVSDRHRSMSLPAVGQERSVELLVTTEQPSRDALARWADRLNPNEGLQLLAVLSQRIGQPGHLSVLVHHVVFDGASAALFFAALSEAFAGGLGDSGGVAPEIEFIAYAEELAARVHSGGFVDGLAYWSEALEGAPTVFGRVGDYGNRSDAVRVKVSLGELSGDVRELARREGVTLFMLLLAVFNVALFRLSGSRDVLVGSPMSTRSSRFRGAVGCFLNTVVLRSSVDDGVAFRELLRGVRRTVSEAIQHRDVPFELVLDALEVKRSASHPPLVQVLFQFDHPIPLPPESPFATLHETYLGASLPISLICGAGGDDIEIELHHDMGGAVGDAIGRLPDSMLELLHVLVEDGASEAPLANTLAVLGPTEQPWTDAASFDHASDGGAGVSDQGVVGDDVLAQVLTEFQTVLRVEDLSASAAFFEHGGDSLAALELAKQLSEAFNVNVKVLDIFEAETPAGVADRLTTLLGVAR